jgi:hypothetical protein
LYYVMPFIDGETLRAKFDRETQLSVEEAVKRTADVADALHCAHTQGDVQRALRNPHVTLAWVTYFILSIVTISLQRSARQRVASLPKKYRAATISLLVSSLLALGCSGNAETGNDSGLSDKPWIVLEEIRALRDADGVPVSLRAADAVLLTTDRWALPDYATQKLIIFDSAGSEWRSVGGRGGGPGEFGLLDGAFSLGADTVAAFDRSTFAVKYFVDGKPASKITRLERWPFGTAFGLVLVGRFANGDWVSLKRAPRNFQATQARLVADTPSLFVGSEGTGLRELMSLPPASYIDLTSSGGSYRLSIDDVAPRTAVVCENGLVVVDTAGIRYYDTSAQLLRTRSIPIARQAISQRERTNIVSNAMRQLELTAPARDAKGLLERQLADVDSAFNLPVIDATGSVWITPIGDSGTPTIFRLAADGSSSAFRIGKLRGVERVGSRTLLVRKFDLSVGESYLELFRIPEHIETPKSPVGSCGRPFRF